ncbi:MAG: transcriptional repressor NrdR [Oscillospiraceae bacterium]|nr:transcriptional repressor NrdR [Oscillospiraceae bacterium]
MKCPFCGYPESKVVDSRPTDESEKIRRRRECLSCKKRFTTYEMIENVPLIVIKKEGSRELFDRNKLQRGLMRACEKRPVTTEQIDELVNDIESYFYNSLAREIPSKKIGEYAMTRLKELDQVAYVRFASVYREFKDIDSFMEELKNMLNTTK